MRYNRGFYPLMNDKYSMKLEDRLEILDLVSGLAYYNDTINEEGYRNLFVEDCNRTIRFRDGEPRDTVEDGFKMGM
jgi:hypothetical protein